ncbi:MAG TPA: hypothetical protein VIK10_03270 [Prolixibacteraceae bacterium]
MKTRNFNLFFFFLVFLAFQANAERTVKKIYKSFPVKQIALLELSNKYGTIQIDDNRKDSVVINVEVWVEGNGNRAQKLLDNIMVNITSSGSTASAETELRDNFNNSNQNFGIDYTVSVPAEKDLTVAQKYGSVNMNNLTGKGTFEIKYGEIRAKNLLSPLLSMDIAYSKAMLDATKDLNLTIRYSKLTLEKSDNLKIDSRYCGLVIGDSKDVILESKYDDFRFKTINSLTTNSMYTGYKIDQILSSLTVSNGYGNISVGTIPASFKSIKVVSKYASVKLGIAAGSSYKLDGTVRYGELKHPEGKLNKTKEDTSYEVHGTIGTSDQPKSVVNIESSYGNVNLVP